uniref:Uncharacterized protein n=1 Tax=Arundo donax TaxID=35708 RepID=A0A0A9DGF7_ARUDO
MGRARQRCMGAADPNSTARHPPGCPSWLLHQPSVTSTNQCRCSWDAVVVWWLQSSCLT